MRFHFLPYELLVFEFGEETGQRAILTSALERGAVVIVHRARGGTSRRALPPLARAHVLQGPTDRTRGARGSPRPVQARPRKRHVGSHDEKAAFLTTREMTDRRVLLLEQAYQGRAMFVKVSCKAGESPVELSHHPELRFRFIPRPHDGAPLIANAVQFEVRLARTRAIFVRRMA